MPIGVGTDPSTGSGTKIVHLDLKESAEHGMGPHGLVVGATGSGKSELLRTLVLGLVMTHPPDQLNLLLVDFKGGATFAGMAELPHVSAVITNLAGELALVDRAQDALEGEMLRRQEALRGAGNLASVHDYTQARERGADLPALPSLLIVVDEFSELLAAKPELTSSSSPSAGWVARSACTCCWPHNGSRKVGSAASSPTCPTGSASGPSAHRSRGPCSGCRTPTSCRRSLAWAISSRTRRPWSGSRPHTCPAPHPVHGRYDDASAARRTRCRTWPVRSPSPRQPGRARTRDPHRTC